MKCIYCKQEIRHPRKEHIIPYALGGRYSSKKIICKDCNEQLGYEVDAKLINWIPFVWARNLFLLTGESGDVPRFEVRDTEGRLYIAEPEWRLRPKDEPPTIIYEIISDQEAKRRFTVRAHSVEAAWRQAEKVKKQFVHHLRRKGRKVHEMDVKTQTHEIRKSIIRPLSFRPSVADFGFDEHYRAIAKIAFEYLATKLESEEILAPEFNVIREFISNGTLRSDDYRKLFLADYRNIYTVCQPQEHWFHRVSVYCNRNTRNVIGLVELFSYVRVAVVLSWQYEGRTQGHYLIEYPLEKRWEEKSLESFEPILTEMVTQINQEQFAENQEVFQERVQMFVAELEDHHTQQHMREVFNEYFSEPLLLTIDDLIILIPKLVSYYAYRSNLVALKRLVGKDATHFLKALLQVQAEKTGITIADNAEQGNHLELIQKMACLQMFIEFLLTRIHQKIQARQFSSFSA